VNYSNSNLAYEYEFETEVKERKRAEATAGKKTKPVSGFVLLVCVVYVITSIASLLFKTAAVNESKTELNSVKTQYEDILNENKKLEVAINTEIDLRKVESVAIAELDMNKPKNSQVVYVNTNPMDYGEIIEEEAEETKTEGLIASAIKSFTGIFAYSN